MEAVVSTILLTAMTLTSAIGYYSWVHSEINPLPEYSYISGNVWTTSDGRIGCHTNPLTNTTVTLLRQDQSFSIRCTTDMILSDCPSMGFWNVEASLVHWDKSRILCEVYSDVQQEPVAPVPTNPFVPVDVTVEPPVDCEIDPLCNVDVLIPQTPYTL